ncbi:MAG: hypothetical protein ACFFG0_56355 [Candidatus Thorarchaeota archaeon]
MNCSNEEYYGEAREYYNKIIDAIHGLFDILNITLDPNSIYFHCGIDNLEVLKSSFIDLLERDFDKEELHDSLCKIDFTRRKTFFKDGIKKKKQ